MKLRSSLIAFGIVVLLAAACKKDNDTFSAQGYWKGLMLVYDAALLNREDGSTRFFLQVPDGDTASAGAVYKGEFISNGAIYRAVLPEGTDTTFIELTQTSDGFMKGFVSSTAQAGQGIRYPVEFWK